MYVLHALLLSSGAGSPENYSSRSILPREHPKRSLPKFVLHRRSLAVQLPPMDPNILSLSDGNSCEKPWCRRSEMEMKIVRN